MPAIQMGGVLWVLLCCLCGCSDSDFPSVVNLGQAGSDAWRSAVRAARDSEGSETYQIRETRGAQILLAEGRSGRVYAFWDPAEGGSALAELAEQAGTVEVVRTETIPGGLLVDPTGSGSWLAEPTSVSWHLPATGPGALRYADPWSGDLVSIWPSQGRLTRIGLPPELTDPGVPDGLTSCVAAGPGGGRVTVFRTAPKRLAAELDENEAWRVPPADRDARPVVYPQAVDVSGSTRLLAIDSPTYELLEIQWPSGSVPIPNAYGLNPPFVALGDGAGRLHVFVHGWSPGDGHMVCHLHETDDGWHSDVIHAVGRQEDAQYPFNLALSACRASDGTLAVGFADSYGGVVCCAFLRDQRWQVQQVANADLVPATAVLWRGGKVWLAYLDLSRGRARLVACGPEGE